MKRGSALVYGKRLNLFVENDAMVALTFDKGLYSDLDYSLLSENESILWQQKIDKNNFSIDFRGSDFDVMVWRALLTIPFGRTITYQQLADQIGRHGAVRAVANAVGRNRIAILVPCHRVVRSDGGLGGFYWGVELKRELLDFESKVK